MAAPMAEEDTSAGEYSDPHLTSNYLQSPNSAEDNVTIAQLTKTSNTQTNVSDAPASTKRRKSKPIRFEVSRTEVQKNQPPKIKIVVRKTSSPSLSLKKDKSPTKGLKTPIPTSPTMIRANEFQSNLGTEFPSCIKMMVRSQVTYGFWMGLPIPFCRSFLPKEDTTFVLEDEKGEQWEVKYIAYKNGLSAGWKNFVVAHDLIEGDVLVFQLIDTFKLKIYILKASESNEVDGALGLLNLEAQREEMTPVTPSPKPKKNKRQPESLSLTVAKKKLKKPTTPSKSIVEVLEHSGTNSSDEIISEVLEPSTPIQPLKDFHIIVNHQNIDSELPEAVKTDYHKLCTYKKQLLHDNLPEGLFPKLVAGMIGETVNIANEIKNCKLTTSKAEFDVWDNSLKSFEILGMKVGFLRDKIRTLVRLVFESEFTVDIKRYMEAKSEKILIDDEIKKVKGRLLELKVTARNVEGVLGCFKEKAEKYMIEFREEFCQNDIESVDPTLTRCSKAIEALAWIFKWCNIPSRQIYSINEIFALFYLLVKFVTIFIVGDTLLFSDKDSLVW
ncbi:hypothetical protein L1887_36289 [Cichorium endivia]|nr:hypothetical protein L1887_36289 [Cichorium endivia]